MLEKKLSQGIVPLLLLGGTSFASVQPNEQYPLQYQKSPVVYAQASQADLSDRLKKADEIARKNVVSAIPFYRRIMVEDGSSKEEAIDRLFRVYESLTPSVLTTDGKHHMQSVIEIALSFYDEVIEKHKDSKHLAKAYLKSGELLCNLVFMLPEKIAEGKKRLEEAYKIGNTEIKTKALFKLGATEYLLGGGLFFYEDKHVYSPSADASERNRLIKSKKYFEEVIGLAPKSDEAKKSRNFLELIKNKLDPVFK